MSRYIKFDDAVKVMACEMYAEAQSQGYDVDGIEDFMPEAKAWLNDAPSIDIVYCRECKRNADNGGLYDDGRTKCPIQEHYALLQDGFCHLGEGSEYE